MIDLKLVDLEKQQKIKKPCFISLMMDCEWSSVSNKNWSKSDSCFCFCSFSFFNLDNFKNRWWSNSIFLWKRKIKNGRERRRNEREENIWYRNRTILNSFLFSFIIPIHPPLLYFYLEKDKREGEFLVWKIWRKN